MNNQKMFIDLISVILIGLFLVRNTEITNSNLLILLLIILFMLNMNELYNNKNCQENYNKEPCSLTDLQKLFDNYMEKKESFEQVQKPTIKINNANNDIVKNSNKRQLSKNKEASNKRKIPIKKVKRESKKNCCFSSTLENPYLSGAPIDIAYQTNYSVDDFDGRYMQ